MSRGFGTNTRELCSKNTRYHERAAATLVGTLDSWTSAQRSVVSMNVRDKPTSADTFIYRAGASYRMPELVLARI